MHELRCISDQDLRAYLLGKLAERTARSVAGHLEDCAACGRRAQGLDEATDPLVEGLRDALKPMAQAGETHATSAPSLGPVDASAPPERLGDYRILGEVGRGGVAVVYKALQDNPDRVVALKVLLAGGHSGGERRARFRAEADTIARLRHVHIVQVFEAGEQDGVPYLALEFCEGGSLAQRLGGKPQPAREAAALIAKLARAVEHAHRAGVIHRDLKPANVLLTADGQPKVSDFGLAKVARPELTATGVLLGTPSYMAPEQAAGQRDVGPAADVYALGAILYELLTGCPPFHGVTPLETLEQTRNQEPVSPSRLQGTTPRNLNTICLTCLRKEPARRYRSAEALADDLERFLDGRPIVARPVGSLERLWLWSRRKPLTAALLGSVALLLAAIAVISSVLAVGWNAEAHRAQHAERDAREKLFYSVLAQARASRGSGRPGQRFESLEALRRAAALGRSLALDRRQMLDVRNEAIASLALTDLRVRQQWAPEDVPLVSAVGALQGPLVAFDSTLDHYACSDLRGCVRVRRVGNDREVARLPRQGSTALYPTFSPDGRFLAVNHWPAPNPGNSLVWDLHRGQIVAEFSGAAQVYILAFSPDSRRFLTGQADGVVSVHDLGTGKVRRLKTGLRPFRVAFRPDGRQVACADNDDPQVHVLDLETGTLVRSLPHPAEIRSLAWSPDGRLLATGCEDRNAYIWDAECWLQESVLEGHVWPVTCTAFHPGGGLLATSSTDGFTRLWDTRSGTLLLTAAGRCIAFNPTGSRLAFDKGRQFGLWEVLQEGAWRRLLYGRPGNRIPWDAAFGAEDLDFAVGGRLLAACGNAGIRFWDLATADELGFLPSGRQESLFFDPEGTRLFAYGRTGLWSMPVQPAPGAVPTTLRVGPPRKLPVPASYFEWRVGRDRTGRRLALNNFGHGVVLLDLPAQEQTALTKLPSLVSHLDLSPDGRWLALSCVPENLCIWDVAGQHAVEPRPPGMTATDRTSVTFSPDGRWLIAGLQHEYRLWRAGRWQEPPRVIPRDGAGFWEGHAAFTRDGRLLALARTQTEIQLIDPETFEEVARLLAPDLRGIVRMRFSPDGRWLAVATSIRDLHVWDLRIIRRGLRELGLEWELPPEASEPLPAPERLRIIPLSGLLEAENLKVTASDKARIRVRDASPRGRGVWSNDHELVAEAEKGGYVEVEVELPDVGRYALGAYFTQGPEFGRVEVSVDGRRLPQVFDAYHDTVVRSERIDFGAVALAAGRHRVRFTAVGKDPRATRHDLAVDCLELRASGVGASGSGP
jgi:WD40 repeat protein